MKLLLNFNGKRSLCILLCLAMCLTVIGCRKKINQPASSDSPSSNEISSVESEKTDSSDVCSDLSGLPVTSSGSRSDISDIYDNILAEDNGKTAVEEKTPYVAPASQKYRKPIVVTEVVKKNEKNYIEYLGKPYLNYGVQVTFDRIHGMTAAQREQFFQKATEIGFKTVIVAVKWNELEPSEGKYNLYKVSELLKFADKYDVNLEILWFGDNVCGSVGNAPPYVINDNKRFPRTGKLLDYSNKELLKVEKAAISQMMNYIYDNDRNHRVTAVQILNEPNYSDVYTAQRDAYLNALDELGMAVKESPYRVVTRVNFVISGEFLSEKYTHPEEVFNLKGIDMVGVDLYTKSLEEFIAYAKRFSSGGLSENVTHFAEAPGNMYNYPKQVLTAFAFNSGYDVYELKCYGATDSDTGIFRVGFDKWEIRDGEKRTQYRWTRGEYVAESVTSDIINLNKMINCIREQIATCPRDQFAMIFRQQQNKISNTKITFQTNEERMGNRVGAAFLANDGYYYFFTPAKEGTFIFNDKIVNASASVGSFVNGIWNEKSVVKVAGKNEIRVKTGNVYRIPADRVQ